MSQFIAKHNITDSWLRSFIQTLKKQSRINHMTLFAAPQISSRKSWSFTMIESNWPNFFRKNRKLPRGPHFLYPALSKCNYIPFLKGQFYKNTRLIFAQNKLRTIPASADEQRSFKFSGKVMNKTAASAAQFAKCILLHANSRTTTAPSCASTNRNFV